MKIYSKNKKARHDYQFIDMFVAGIQLYGTEVKSIKNGGVDLTGSYIVIDSDGNAQWLNGFVEHYKFNTQSSHEERRTRQLLLHKKELKKLKALVQQERVTIVPYTIGATSKGFLKLEIYTAKGKNTKDKRESIKQRDAQRESKRYY